MGAVEGGCPCRDPCRPSLGGFLAVLGECIGDLKLNLTEFIPNQEGRGKVVGIEGGDPHDLAKDASEFGAEPVGRFPFGVDVFVCHGVEYSRIVSCCKPF